VWFLLWLVSQQLAEPFEGPQATHHHRPLGDAEDRRNLADLELLEVSHDQDFTVGGGEPVEGRPYAVADFLADQASAGAGSAGDELAGQIHGGLIGEPHPLALLASDAAALGLDMMAVQTYQILPGKLPEPRVERQRAVLQIVEGVRELN